MAYGLLIVGMVNKGHRHGDACCQDCGSHSAGTCYGCDRRRRNAARRENAERNAERNFAERFKKMAVNEEMLRAAAKAASGGY